MGQGQPSEGLHRGQHFLLSSAARRLNPKKIARLTEAEACGLFERVRWSETGGQPVCPKCGCLAIYRHKSRAIFTCKACQAQFSVTSGTIFHGRKLAVSDILYAIAIFTNGAKGHAALQLSRDLQTTYKTAFVLAHKLREALGAEIDERIAEGVVEIDGAYFGGYVQPANYVENRVDRRLTKNQNGKRRVVIVARERGGRTLSFVVRREADAAEILTERIRAGSTVHADEAPSWDQLGYYAGFDLRRINHKEAYSDNGACTNQAESLFSRLRRAEIGIHHHIAGPYLHAYAHEIAWREDARRIDNETQFLLIVQAAATHAPSAHWKGYWRRTARGP